MEEKGGEGKGMKRKKRGKEEGEGFLLQQHMKFSWTQGSTKLAYLKLKHLCY